MSIHHGPGAFENAEPEDAFELAPGSPLRTGRSPGEILAAVGLAILGGIFGLFFGLAGGLMSGLIDLC